MEYSTVTNTALAKQEEDALTELFKAIFSKPFSRKFLLLKINDAKVDRKRMQRNPRSGYYTDLAELRDLFEADGIDTDDLITLEDFEAALAAAGSSVPDELMDNPLDVNHPQMRFIKHLYENLYKFTSPEASVRQVVDQQSRQFGDPWGNGSIRLRILKQLIKYADYLWPLKVHGKGFIQRKADGWSENSYEWLDQMGEDIFDGVSIGKPTHAKDADALLKIADQLSHGECRNRDYIFAFGMAFNMKFPTDSDIELEPQTNIERLFQKTFADNLMEGFQTADTKKRKQRVSSNKGNGINYKDCRDIIWLYYLHQTVKIDPANRDNTAKLMQERFRNAVKTQEKAVAELQSEKTTSNGSDTQSKKAEPFYGTFQLEDAVRNDIELDSLMNLKEDAFQKKVTRKWGMISDTQSQNTAYAVYKYLVNKIQDITVNNIFDDVQKAEVEKIKEREYQDAGSVISEYKRRMDQETMQNNQILDKIKAEVLKKDQTLFLNIHWLKKNKDTICQKLQLEDNSKIDQLISVLSRMDDYIWDDNLLKYNDPQEMNRSLIEAVYYQYYNVLFKAGLIFDNDIDTFDATSLNIPMMLRRMVDGSASEFQYDDLLDVNQSYSRAEWGGTPLARLEEYVSLFLDDMAPMGNPGLNNILRMCHYLTYSVNNVFDVLLLYLSYGMIQTKYLEMNQPEERV